MYDLQFLDNYYDQKVKDDPLFFSLVFARTGEKQTHTTDQKQTFYFNRPKEMAITGSFRTDMKSSSHSDTPPPLHSSNQCSNLSQAITFLAKYLDLSLVGCVGLVE